MNNKKIYIAVAVLVVVLAAGWFSYSQNKVVMDDGAVMEDKGDAPSDSMQKPEDVMMDKPTSTTDVMMDKPTSTADAMMQKGSYETYAPEKLVLAQDGKVVLFFRASWCPTCRALDADIRANLGSIPKGVTILDVDYDNSTALKQKYGITYQHTLVQVDAQGNQISKWTGSPNLAALLGKVI